MGWFYLLFYVIVILMFRYYLNFALVSLLELDFVIDVGVDRIIEMLFVSLTLQFLCVIDVAGGVGILWL